MGRVILWATLWLGLCGVPAVWAATVPEIKTLLEIHNSAGAGFFRCTLPLPATVSEEWPILVARVESGELFLVHATVSPLPSPRNIIVTGRFKAAGPARLTLLWRTPAGEPAPLMTLPLELPAGESIRPEIRSAWAAQEQKILLGQGADSFSLYWNQIIAPQYGLAAERPYGDRTMRGAPRRSPPDLYSIFSGAAAIQESLQLDLLAGGLRNDPYSASEEIPLATLIPPQIKSHPFHEMLQGRSPAIPSLASLIPAEQYAVFFRDIDKEIEFTDLLAEWGGTLLNQIEPNGQDFHVQERLTRQLCLETGKLARLFGARIVDSMAFTGNDPFLREGTDFTVLFRLKKPERFRQEIEGRYADVVASGEGERREVSINGQRVIAVTSKDRAISSYAFFAGDLAIISTSPAALAKILAVQQGGGSLAQSEDFLYMRTIFPQGAEEEDLFIYLSDPHIRALTGPRAKIGEARRVRCAANLTLFGNAVLWFRAEHQHDPTLAELRAGGYLGKIPPRCPDHGDYDLDCHGLPICSVHNRIGQLTPLVEIPLEKVTKTEATEYRTFVEGYNRYWSKFFDPIGIRIRMGETVRIQTCILPLIENSWYDGLATLAGKAPGTLSAPSPLPRTVLSLRGDIDPELLKKSSLLRDLEENRYLRFDWLSHEFSLNLCDGQPLFTPGGPGLGMILAGGGRTDLDTLVLGYLASALNLPTYLTFKVNDPLKAQEGLPRLLQHIVSRYGEESEEFGLESYTLESDGSTPIYVASATIFVAKIRLYLAVVGDQLVIASRRDILTDLIAVKGTHRPAPTTAGNFDFSLFRGAFQELSEAINLDYQEQVRHACTMNLPATSLLLKGLDLPAEQVPATIATLRGFEPICPAGGGYRVDPEKGYAGCTVHGSRIHQRQPRADDRSSMTLRLVNNLERVSARLTFTPEGLMTTVEIQRQD